MTRPATPLFALFACAALACAACGSTSATAVAGADTAALDTTGGGDLGADTTTAPDLAASDGTAAPDGASACTWANADSDGKIAAPMVTINEVSGKGAEWVELFNAGQVAVDLSGWVLADRAADGCPKLADSVTFTPGTSLKPAEYLLVQGGKNNATPGPQTNCLKDGGPATCFHAGFGVSATNGETLFLFQGETMKSKVELPPNMLVTGRTWGRIPDGSGTFQLTSPTPGTGNTP